MGDFITRLCAVFYLYLVNRIVMKNIVLLFCSLLPLIANCQIADSVKREVKLEGAINFRDIGGYTTWDGKHVKWGKIYRAAALNKLTATDFNSLHKLSLAVIADFRGPYEVKAAPDLVPDGIQRISLPAGSENIGDSNYMKNMTRLQNRDSFLIAFYSDLTPFKERYTAVFDALLQLPKDSSLVFHCSAGKDRTGIAAALVLSALGVQEETIMQDYLATNYYRRKENERAIPAMIKMYGLSEATAKNMMAAREEYLQATFNSIKARYGSVNNYLEKEFGLTAQKTKLLRALYLE
jgi:protein-tyrosine phosphatase